MNHELRPSNRSWEKNDNPAVNRLLEMTKKLNELREKSEGIRKKTLPGLFPEAGEGSPSSEEASRPQ